MSSSIPFDHGYGQAGDWYCRDELDLRFHLAMGRASEASTSLQGIACNMATLAAIWPFWGGQISKFAMQNARRLYREDPFGPGGTPINPLEKSATAPRLQTKSR